MMGRRALPAHKRETTYEILKAISQGVNYARTLARHINKAESPFCRVLYRLRDEGFIEILNDKKDLVVIDEKTGQKFIDLNKNYLNIKFYKLTKNGEDLLKYFEEKKKFGTKYEELFSYCENNIKKINSSKAIIPNDVVYTEGEKDE